MNSFGQDKVLFGTDFPYRQFYPEQAKVVQVDLRAPGIRVAVTPPGGSREVADTLVEDFSKHPFAGLPVTVTLMRAAGSAAWAWFPPNTPSAARSAMMMTSSRGEDWVLNIGEILGNRRATGFGEARR